MPNELQVDQSGTTKFRSLWNKPAGAKVDEPENRVTEFDCVARRVPSASAWLTSARIRLRTGLAFASSLLGRLGQVLPPRPDREPRPWRPIAPTFAKHERDIVRICRLMLIGYSGLALILTFGVIASVAWKHRGDVSGVAATIAKTRLDIQEISHADASRTANSVPIRR